MTSEIAYRSDNEPRAVIFDTSAASVLDGPGSRVVVFFQGCHIGCAWCHSPHSIPYTSPLFFLPGACIMCGRCAKACLSGVHKLTDGMHHLDRTLCFQCGRCIEACPRSSANRKSGALHLPTREVPVSTLFEQLHPALSMADGITLSGGEALLQTEAAISLLQLCREHGVHTAVETSGLLDASCYISAAPYIDIWLFGIRVLTSSDGAYQTENILAALRCIRQCSNAAIFPRMPMIPGVMDDPEALQYMLHVLKHIHTDEVWLNPWNRFFTHYYELSGIKPSFPSPSEDEIQRCESVMRAFFLRNGYKVSSAVL